MGSSGLVVIGRHVKGGSLGYDGNMAVVWMDTCYTTFVGLNIEPGCSLDIGRLQRFHVPTLETSMEQDINGVYKR